MNEETELVPRKPDYRLKIKNKATGGRATIGSAWANKDGSISIQVMDMLKVELDSSKYITLFPIKEGDKEA